MSRVHIASDFHLESLGFINNISEPDCDFTILAGDISPISTNPKSIKWLKEKYTKPVIYVPGNHEYYTYPFSMDDVEDSIRIFIAETNASNIIFLQNEVTYINGIRIIGCTLWTDYNLYDTREKSMAYARRCMNDYYFISAQERGKFVTPEILLDKHNESVEFLIKELSTPYEGKTIVVTHHCPAPGSIHPMYEGDALNPAFTSDLSNLILSLEPDYWIHGHTHSSFDYYLGKTRIICNPLGYQSRSGKMENVNFKKDLVIDV